MFIAIPACLMGGTAVFDLYFGAIQPCFFLFRRVGGVWWGGFDAKFGVNWLVSLMGRAWTAIKMRVFLVFSGAGLGCGWTRAYCVVSIPATKQFTQYR